MTALASLFNSQRVFENTQINTSYIRKCLKKYIIILQKLFNYIFKPSEEMLDINELWLTGV